MAGFGGAVKLTGESEYRKALKQIQQNLREVSTEMKAVSSSYDKNDKSVASAASQAEKLNAVQEKQKKSLAELKTQYNAMSAEYTEQKAKHEQLINTYNEEKAKLETLEKTVGKASTEYKEQKAKVQELASEVKKSTTAQEANEKSMSQMRIAINKAETDVNKTSQAIRELKDNTEKANGGFTVFKGTLANIAADALIRVTEGLKDLARGTLEAGMNFEASMSKVQAVSGASADDMEKLTAKAKEMGAQTKFSASESAEAFNYMAMAGWKTEDMIDGISGIMNLAAASGADLATSSDIVTDALTAMGYSAGDAGKLADVMAAASSNANTNVEMMGATFKYAAPIVGALGYSMEDTAVAIGLMANSGIKAEQAGTSLRSMLTRLSAPPAECAAAMEELGLSITDAEGNMKPMNQVIDEMRLAFDGLGEAEQTEMAKKIAGTEAMSGLLAIVNAAPEDYEKLTEAVNNSSGAAQEMADTMMDNAQGGWTLLQSKIEGIQIELYEKLQPAIQGVIDFLDKLADGVQWVVDNGNEIIGVITGLATATGIYVAYTTALTVMKEGWMALSVVQKIVAASQTVLNAVMAMNPIGIVVAAIAGLVAAFIYLWNTSEDFRNFWIGLWDTIKEAAQPIIEGLVQWFKDAWTFISEAWAGAGQFFTDIWTAIQEAFSAVGEWFSEKFTAAWTAVSTAFSAAIRFFSDIWTGIKNTFNAVGTWFGDKFRAAWKAVSDAFKGAKTFFSDIWTGIKNTFKSVGTWFSGKFQEAYNAVTRVFKNIGTFFSGIWDGIKTTFSALGTSIGSAISGAVKSGINGVISMIQNTINGAIDLINGAIGLINKLPGVSVGTIGRLSLPRLARGGIVNNATLAEIGEDGAEIVMPLEHNTKWMRGVAREMAAEMNAMNLSQQMPAEQADYGIMMEAFKDALSEMKIELDGDDMGRFIDRTVTRLVYN